VASGGGVALAVSSVANIPYQLDERRQISDHEPDAQTHG